MNCFSRSNLQRTGKTGHLRKCIPAADLSVQRQQTKSVTAPNFCMLLRKHIANGRIVGISQPSLERIIRFEIEHLDELGDLCRKSLIVEIMGKHSNIIFCNEKGMIIDSIKHVSAQMSSVREVLPGREYFIPDTMKKENPLGIPEENFTQELRSKPMPVGKAIYNSFTGISPVVAEEICYLAGIDSSVPASEMSGDLLAHLYRQFTYFMEQVTESKSLLLFITMEMSRKSSHLFCSPTFPTIR